MATTALYRQHLAVLEQSLSDALARAGKKGVGLDGVLFHAGREEVYHADDELVPFRATPHFRHWVPLPGPDHAVLARPGKKPLVIRVSPKDYWYDTAPPPASYWEEAVDLVELERFEDLTHATGALPRIAYVGNSSAAAEEAGIPANLIEPPELMAPLDWHRGRKTAYEVELLKRAAERGGAGHRAGRRAFEEGASEREVYWAFLAGSDQVDNEPPFGSIVAFDAKASILHYQHKRARGASPGNVLLLDAGASYEGYASDTTRTWTRGAMPAEFRALVAGVDTLERRLVAMVAPGVPYVDIHFAAHRFVAELLLEVGILRTNVEEALVRRLTSTFFPHGVGHHLGIQVHDIAGRQAGPDGGTNAPPEDHKYLRNTRVLEEGHYVTIEPGIYFIDLLLEPLRQSPDAGAVNWQLIDALRPCGGVRIEDDVLCTAAGPVDLTREHCPGP